jgi:hypothetical protein
VSSIRIRKHGNTSTAVYYISEIGPSPGRAVGKDRKGNIYWLINYINTKTKFCHLKNWLVKGLCGRFIHGLNNYIDTKAKCRYLKIWPVKGLCGRCLSVWGPSPSRFFLLGVPSIFAGSESAQIQRVKHLQNMVSNRNQHPPPPTPSQPHTVCIYCTFTQGRRVGELNKKEGKRGNNSQSWVEKTNMTDCISSL